MKMIWHYHKFTQQNSLSDIAGFQPFTQDNPPIFAGKHLFSHNLAEQAFSLMSANGDEYASVAA